MGFHSIYCRDQVRIPEKAIINEYGTVNHVLYNFTWANSNTKISFAIEYTLSFR